MRSDIAVTGATGLVGRALARSRPIAGMPRDLNAALGWDPDSGRVCDDGRPLRALVHLAGENAAGGRWTARKRRAIRDSREKGTRAVVDWLASRSPRPEVLVSSSGIGIYGDRGEEVLAEDAGAGQSYLAEVTRMWEALALRAEEAGIRVVILRIGAILSCESGALGQVLPAFRAGLGGRWGRGTHWFPWVHIDDVVGAISWAIETPSASGIYNVMAPGIVRHGDYVRALASALRRPAPLPLPRWALRLGFGDLADELMLASVRAIPRRLQAEGYPFSWPVLEPALADLLAA